MSARLSFQQHWHTQEKPAINFLLKLLLLLTFIKLLFYGVNHQLVQLNTFAIGCKMLGWSILYDTLVVIAINLPFLLLLFLFSFFKPAWPVKIINIFFLLLNLFCVLLNLADIPYFHFHAQRADADLLYVLNNPLEKTFLRHPFYSLAAVVLIAMLAWLLFRIHKKLLNDFIGRGKKFPFICTIAILIILLSTTSRKKFLPTYPLVNLSSAQLQFVQNSLHTFLYSVFRKEEGLVHPYQWLPVSATDSLISVKKSLAPIPKRNIVLFIMESIPEDYFHANGKYKVAMPFMDSLLDHCTYFGNAYSYSHHSNKGIVALLTGIPTLTEIPLYHSQYADLPKTPIGTLLSEKGYTTSFTIGDAYDDFGFAKCCNWLGIQQYYCKADIPRNKDMEYHSLGLHDAYVLDFFGNNLQQSLQPFFAIQYNISTHYPNDLPKNYTESFPQLNFSPGMKSMHYYTECLRDFFYKAKTQPWFNETVFIFASDHWMYPDEASPVSDITQRFRIPIFIFDPKQHNRKEIQTPVSQLDIMNTILQYGGITDSILSYGESLLSHNDAKRIVVMRENATLYQAVDENYVIGFNPVNDTVEFVYDLKKDPAKKINLAGKVPINHQLNYLKAFLQKASWQYHKKLY